MNSISKRAVMKGVVHSFKGECLFILETKMENIDDQVIMLICPWSNSLFSMSPSVGALGGILLLWNRAFGEIFSFCFIL